MQIALWTTCNCIEKHPVIRATIPVKILRGQRGSGVYRMPNFQVNTASVSLLNKCSQFLRSCNNSDCKCPGKLTLLIIIIAMIVY